MKTLENEDNIIYKVVVNLEQQYAIWPADRENPPGWREAGKRGLKEACLSYIKEVWTDMRPLSLRKKMERPAHESPGEPAPTGGSPGRETLVSRLSTGRHPVEVVIRPERTIRDFKECIDRGYVHVRFSRTAGGTELGVKLDPAATDLKKADFVKRTGLAHLVGELTLECVRVRCIADVDLGSLEGVGHLEPTGG